MKPTATPHLIPIAAWRQARTNTTRHAVLDRIQTITRELEALQAEMHIQLAESAGQKKASFVEDGKAVQVLSQFKAELDQLRRTLWFYIEKAAQKPDTTMDHEQARRLERVTGLLSALSPQPPTANPGTEQSGSFFERLNVVIESYMQEKKPAAAESNTAPSPTKAFS